MLNGTHQWIMSARMLCYNCLDTFRNRFKTYERGIISNEEFEQLENEFNEIISQRLSKERHWQRLSRDYRINFYGKDFDKFIKKTKHKQLNPPISIVSERRNS